MKIDNYRKAKALMRKMEMHLPIPVRATNELVRLMKPHGLRLKRNQELSIRRLFYLSDAGGISCDLTPPGAESALVCSLTHLEVSPDHPLAEEIRAYQKTRKESLARDAHEPSSVLISPGGKATPRKRKRQTRKR